MAVDFSRFADVLKSLGVTGEVRELPEPAPTAAAAAQQLGCEVGAIANSLVFDADGAPLLVMTSGAHRVDTSRVASLTGSAAVKRADARSVREWTGQAIGGVGPVAHPAPIRTLVDTWLSKYDVVWAAAGHPHTVFPTAVDELIRITGGTAVARGISSLLALPGHSYDHVVATEDYHIDPGSHFAAEPDYAQSWPPHCVAGSHGAELHPDLDTRPIEAVFRKGQHAAAYSGFEGADDQGTPLADWLRQHDVDEVDVAGIATDYCVRATAADAVKAGFRTNVLLGLTAGVDPGTTAEAISTLQDAGVTVTPA